MINFYSILDKIIQFDTTSHKSNFEVISYIEHLFEKKNNYKIYKVLNSEKNKSSILIKPKENFKKGILFSGHIDTVSVEGQKWSSDPFKLKKRNNKLFGRGTSDMKGFLSVVISNMLNNNDKNLPFYLSITHDEETGCQGIKNLSKFINSKNISLPSMCIVGEPTKLKIVTANKGVEVFDTIIETKKEHGHSSNYNQRVNTITLSSEMIVYLQFIQSIIPKKNILMCSPNNTSIHIGMLNGGTSHNIIPKKSQFRTEIRYVKDDLKFVKNKFLKFQKKLFNKYLKYINDFKVNTKILAEVPGLQEKNQKKIKNYMKNLNISENYHVPYGTEAGIIQKLGPSTIIFGPGSIEQAHKPNEFILIDQLEKFDRLLKQMK